MGGGPQRGQGLLTDNVVAGAGDLQVPADVTVVEEPVVIGRQVLERPGVLFFNPATRG